MPIADGSRAGMAAASSHERIPPPRPEAELRDRLETIVTLAADLGRKVGALWARVSLLAVLGFALAAGALLGFVGIADVVLEGETREMDEAALEWIAAVRVDWLDDAAMQITALGNLATLTVVTLAAGVVLWAVRRRISFALLLISLATGVLANRALKIAFGRPRPQLDAPLAEEVTASFPSGHAMSAAITYGTVAFLIGRIAVGRLRWATWSGAAVLVLLIGLSRMYVGVHYPTDVVAGWLGGIAWTGLLVALFRVLGVFSRESAELEGLEAELDERGDEARS